MGLRSSFYIFCLLLSSCAEQSLSEKKESEIQAPTNERVIHETIGVDRASAFLMELEDGSNYYLINAHLELASSICIPPYALGGSILSSGEGVVGKDAEGTIFNFVSILPEPPGQHQATLITMDDPFIQISFRSNQYADYIKLRIPLISCETNLYIEGYQDDWDILQTDWLPTFSEER